MSAFSTKSFWTLDTNNSTKTYAIAGSDPSYKYYNNITWSMWGMWSPGLNKDMFSMYEDTSSAARSWLFSVQTDRTFRIIGSWDGTNICLFTTANPVLDFGWHHFVVTFTNGVFSLYIDNVLQSFTTIIPWGGGNTLNAANEQVLIANKCPVSGPNFDDSSGGGYSNFSMWNKVLSAPEITALFNNGQPGDLTQHSAYANLTNWWRMDQTDTVPTLTDSRAAGASATIHVSGGTPFFQQNNNVPIYSTDPGVANVKIGTAYVFQGNAETGTYDGSDRWSDPGIDNVADAIPYKANSLTNNRTGDRVQPVVGDVKLGVAFGPNSGLTGTNVGTGFNTDPGVGNVANGVAYKIDNVDLVGTRNSVTNVLQSATLVGQSLTAILKQTGN